MVLRIGTEAPDFSAETTAGRVNFHDWIAGHWCLLFSHPKDFTPVCTTELGQVAALQAEFERRDCKVIGLGTDPVDSHAAWVDDIAEICGVQPAYPIIADTDLAVARLFGMLPAEERAGPAPRTAEQNKTVRSVFVIDPQRTIRLILAYPMSCGRNFSEILRTLDSLQLTDRHRLSTPAGWRPGEDVLIPAATPDDEVAAAFPAGWHGPKPYLRYVPQPESPRSD
jgi:alkyl hydroperoxide reductase subunit AhpC